MPTVFRHLGYRFFFYSNEVSPREPVHIHVRNGSKEAKLWLRPEPSVASSHGFDARELREVLTIVEQQRELIERKWNEYFA